MTERQVLEHRLTTLASLLDGTTGLLGPGGGTLTTRLHETWAAERRLLERLLTETPGQDVRATIDLWQARTRAFLERSGDGRPGWTDGHGGRWDANQVLALLTDLEERLDAWLLVDTPPPDGGDEDA